MHCRGMGAERMSCGTEASPRRRRIAKQVRGSDRSGSAAEIEAHRELHEQLQCPEEGVLQQGTATEAWVSGAHSASATEAAWL